MLITWDSRSFIKDALLQAGVHTICQTLGAHTKLSNIIMQEPSSLLWWVAHAYSLFHAVLLFVCLFLTKEKGFFSCREKLFHDPKNCQWKGWKSAWNVGRLPQPRFHHCVKMHSPCHLTSEPLTVPHWGTLPGLWTLGKSFKSPLTIIHTQGRKRLFQRSD